MRLVNRRATIEEHTDAELVEAAGLGDETAFSTLYRRHAQAAFGLAMSVSGNADDAADAVSDAFTRVLRSLATGELREPERFRSYLLTTTRNAALDNIREGRRLRLTDDDAVLDQATGISATERLSASIDAALVAAAFRTLPERWRSVLWLTEVEGIPVRDAGPLMGLSANSAAQLALRARNGLRERYLQAHLKEGVARDCSFTVGHLGAYVAGRLAPRDLAKVDQHLAGCAPCTAKRDELEEVGAGLRRIALPLPIVLGPAAIASWKAGTASVTAANAAATKTSLLELANGLIPAVQRPLMVAASGVFALGVISATVVGDPDGALTGGRVRPPVAITPTNSPPPAPQDDAELAGAAIEEPRFVVPTDFSDFEVGAGANAAPTAPTAADTATAPGGGDDAGGTAPPVVTPPPEPKPLAATGIAATVGPVDLAVSLDAGEDPCNGAAVGDTTVGCEPETQAPGGTAKVVVSPEGTLIGPLDGKTTTIGL